MLKVFVRRHLRRQREIILGRVLEVQGLMQLLMKPRNTDQPWTPEELGRLRAHLKGLARLAPSLLVFLLPGGLFLLPVLAEVLDRRRVTRKLYQ